jgi:hypothetical protein
MLMCKRIYKACFFFFQNEGRTFLKKETGKTFLVAPMRSLALARRSGHA